MAKHIIIGTSGIGGALARKLKGQGVNLHLIARDEAKLRPLAEELAASHAVADVLDAGALAEAVKAAGPEVDGLAYCVGTIKLVPLSRLGDEAVRSDFEVNALGAFRAVKAAVPALKASKQENASVVLFSTVAVRQGFSSHVSVAMAKGAVEGLTMALAAELAPKVRVNALAPSLTRTPLAEPLTRDNTMAKAIADMHPIPRLGEANDPAAFAAFLLSPESSWVTGQVIGVDGGRGHVRLKG